MSLWYMHNASLEMKFYSTQTVEKDVHRHNFLLSHREKEWTFTEMPLQQSLKEYTVENAVIMLSIFATAIDWNDFLFCMMRLI